MSIFNKGLRVYGLYGANGHLETTYISSQDAKPIKKRTREFIRELNKSEREFMQYASMDIDAARINSMNSEYIRRKLRIADDYISQTDNDFDAWNFMEELDDGTVAIGANESARKTLGLSAKLAAKFQPFFEKRAEKNPKLRGLSDIVTKAANGGRMPLTADSVANLRMAFDRKYYNDLRRPDADRNALREQYEAAVGNLEQMAVIDGVDRKEIAERLGRKIAAMSQVDETTTDIYKGMATGKIRYAPTKVLTDENGKAIMKNGRPAHALPSSFVSSEQDEEGNYIPLDPWSFKVREPETIDSAIEDYKMLFMEHAKYIKSEAQLKKFLSSDTYGNMERNLKTFAMDDCPAEADKLKHEFRRANLICCKEWALSNGITEPYSRIQIPPSYDEIALSGSFYDEYVVSDYEDIADNSVYNDSLDDVFNLSDEELEDKLRDDVQHAADESNNMEARVAELEAKLEAFRNGFDKYRDGTEAAFAEKDAEIAALKAMLAERDETIKNLREQTAETVQPQADDDSPKISVEDNISYKDDPLPFNPSFAEDKPFVPPEPLPLGDNNIVENVEQLFGSSKYGDSAKPVESENMALEAMQRGVTISEDDDYSPVDDNKISQQQMPFDDDFGFDDGGIEADEPEADKSEVNKPLSLRPVIGESHIDEFSSEDYNFEEDEDLQNMEAIDMSDDDEDEDFSDETERGEKREATAYVVGAYNKDENLASYGLCIKTNFDTGEMYYSDAVTPDRESDEKNMSGEEVGFIAGVKKWYSWAKDNHVDEMITKTVSKFRTACDDYKQWFESKNEQRQALDSKDKQRQEIITAKFEIVSDDNSTMRKCNTMANLAALLPVKDTEYVDFTDVVGEAKPYESETPQITETKVKLLTATAVDAENNAAEVENIEYTDDGYEN